MSHYATEIFGCRKTAAGLYISSVDQLSSSDLQEALQRDANNAEALINMIVCGQFLGKAPEVGVVNVRNNS
jgi:hypothetical protein